MQSDELSPAEYAEPIFYCGSCHSLAITAPDPSLADEDWDGSYCMKCHSTDVLVGKFGDWLKEEERRAQKRKEIEWRK